MEASSSHPDPAASSSAESADRSSVLPPPSLSAGEDDEALRQMMDRMATHKPAATPPTADDDDEDEDGDETWHDALEDDDDSAQGEIKDEAMLSSDQLETCLSKSNDLKTTANALFLAPSQPPSTNISSALAAYLRAIASLPPRPTPPATPTPAADAPTSSSQPTDDAPRIEEITKEEAEVIERGETGDERVRREATTRVKEMRAMLWANVAACYLKLDQNKEAVEACTESLTDSPQYIKPLHRRITANVALGTWSSLTAAESDLKTLLPLLPQSSQPSPLRRQLERLARDLPAQIKTMQEKEKDEMMDKLKGLGNSVLGKFGLSTDNFKFEPNGAGGYSMNFVR